MGIYVNNTKGTYKYTRGMRDGSTREVVAVIRSRTAKRQAKKAQAARKAELAGQGGA